MASNTTKEQLKPHIPTNHKSPHIGIVGKGALGLLYAHIVTTHLGEGHVTFVMDEARLAAHANDIYTINGTVCDFATVTPDKASPVDLVIVATKAPGLNSALPLIEPLLGENTCIISILNGITSERRIAERYGWDRICGAVSQGMDAMRFGSTLNYAHYGEVRIGALPQTGPDTTSKVDTILTEVGIPHTVWDDIEYRIWAKFMLNVGINQVCCAYGSNYGDVVGTRSGEQYRLFVAAMREVIAVAQAEGVNLKEDELTGMVELLETLDLSNMPSMAQDRINQNPSEVDEFAGEVCRMAAKHNILVPANEYLRNRILTIEATYHQKPTR